jgi:hypothetical protein
MSFFKIFLLCDCYVTGPGGLSKEVRIQRFKQLLLEGNVNAFSFYAKVKGKLEKDDR